MFNQRVFNQKVINQYVHGQKEPGHKMFSKKIFILLLFSLFLLGCRTAPIMEITDAPIETASGKKPPLSNVTKQITSAGIQLGWQMKKVKSGHIVATLYLRDHMVQVDIRYSTKTYSITYKNSSEMKYDGTNIHSNYNAWVQRLNNSIRTNVFNGNP